MSLELFVSDQTSAGLSCGVLRRTHKTTHYSRDISEFSAMYATRDCAIQINFLSIYQSFNQSRL